ncbi:unnamed protein product [Blepharisma stoltei]|uniref:RING-type domain-containing protein n=1 Tax=Blepharisma stoltei TaxID=1481888 RepID=A0AAU9JVM3_9CILI|nr:unnamed protein product [Blepharisma stoltei]
MSQIPPSAPSQEQHSIPQPSNPFLNPFIPHSLPRSFTEIDSKGISDKGPARILELPRAAPSSFQPSANASNPFLPPPANSSNSGITDPSSNPIQQASLISKSSQIILKKESTQVQFQNTNPTENQAKNSIELNCPICYEKYGATSNIPKVLYCGHSVCEQCLNKIRLEANKIICPFCSCRERRHFAAIPINYALFGIIGENKPLYVCKDHQKEIGLLCKDDYRLLCISCMVEHNKHEVVLLDDPFVLELADKKKQEIEQLKFEIQGKLKYCVEVFAKLEEDHKRIATPLKNNLNLLERTRNKLFNLIEKASRKVIEEKNKNGNEALIRNNVLRDTYIASKNKYLKRFEKISELSEEFGKLSIAQQINSEMEIYKEEFAMPRTEDIEEFEVELMEPVDYEAEILKNFTELLKIN